MNDQIQIKTETHKYFKKNRQLVIELIKESMKISFPNDVITGKKIDNRYEKMIHHLENGSGKVIVVEDGNILLGYLWYFTINKNRIHINQIVINEKNRGQGLGSKLLEKLYQEAKSNRISEIELNVTKANEMAVAFYEKEKFEVERILLKRDINV